MDIGDVVYLNSNPEHRMTVTFVLGMEAKGLQEKLLEAQMKRSGFEDGDVFCTWIVNNEVKTYLFKRKMISAEV